MNSPQMTPLLGRTSCNPFLPLDTPINPIEIEDVEIEISGSSSMPIDGRGGGGQAPLPRKKRNVAYKSAAWEHFTRDKSTPNNDPVAHCNYCGASYKCHPKNNGTSFMLYHVTVCQKYKSLQAKQDRNQSKFTFGAKQDGTGNNLMIAKFSKKVIREKLCEMIIVDEMPFMTMEGKGFLNFVKALEPRFKVHSCYTMMKDSLKLYIKDKNTLKNTFLTTGQRVCLTTDTRTSAQNMSYICVTGHFIDPNWTYHKRILTFHRVSDHKGQTIAKELKECLVEWGIHRMLTISVDQVPMKLQLIGFKKKKLCPIRKLFVVTSLFM
jgi:hypothetical protein